MWDSIPSRVSGSRQPYTVDSREFRRVNHGFLRNLSASGNSPDIPFKSVAKKKKKGHLNSPPSNLPPTKPSTVNVTTVDSPPSPQVLGPPPDATSPARTFGNVPPRLFNQPSHPTKVSPPRHHKRWSPSKQVPHSPAYPHCRGQKPLPPSKQ